MIKRKFIYLLVLSTCLVNPSCKKDKIADPGTLQLTSIQVGSQSLNLQGAANTDVPPGEPIIATFTSSIDLPSASQSVTLSSNGNPVPLQITLLNENKSISAKPVIPLESNKTYLFTISSSLTGTASATFSGISVSFTTQPATFNIISVTVSGKDLLSTGIVSGVNRNFPAVIKMDRPVDGSSLSGNSIGVFTANSNAVLTYSLSDSGKTLTLQAIPPLIHFEKYTLKITSSLKAMDGSVFAGFSKDFYTELDPAPKFPVLSDDDLLTLIQQQTFTYFWDFAHPVSGLARERDNSGDVVTIGGSGFEVMAILVGINRNFITRQAGIDRLEKIIDFLSTADRFHGAWPHWMNGSTGKVIPFSTQDDGADLVETSYLIQGLLTVRQFLNSSDSQENSLLTKINDLWNSVEWDWFTNGGQNVLYWHWSPDFGWASNNQIKGYDEALITYILAAGSPAHSIDAAAYHNGWASNGAIVNGNSYYGFTLPVGEPYGGPLFFAHYSFLGFNPHNLKDNYADYWEQNVNHSQINRAYCIDDPHNFVGYSEQCWGLTASDDQQGYSAHSPTYDLGVITPTAAISSMPYTPAYSMDALKFFYYTIGDKTWGQYGFYDAFNVTGGWWATSDLAIDEGPIIIMIENYRTGLLWDLFMSNPEVTAAMNKLGFTN